MEIKNGVVQKSGRVGFKMINFERTTSKNLSFINLIRELDESLWEIYHTKSDYEFDVDLKVDNIDTVVLASIKSITVGGGCFKPLSPQIAEVKRMFVNPYFRGLGVASGILDILTDWARELGYKTLVLETGTKQKDAISLYEKNGFAIIENFGPYIGNKGSVCMGKTIN